MVATMSLSGRGSRALRALAFAFFALMTFSPALAGPGAHNPDGSHSDGAAVASSQSPRVVATSESFQLVGILKNNVLTIYVDQEADNAPVVGAKITLEIAGVTMLATPTPSGTYEVPANDAFTKQGEHEMVFTIVADAKTDLLGGVLIVPNTKHSAAAGAHVHLWDRVRPFVLTPQAGMAAGGALAVFLLGSVLRRRSKRNAGSAMGLAAFVALGLIASQSPVAAGPGHAGDEGHSHGPETAPGASDFPRRLPDASVFFPKPAQRLVNVRTAVVQASSVRKAARLPGRVIPDPNRSAVVQTTVEGRILPANGKFVHVGQAVKAGDVLAIVEPALAAISQTEVEQALGQLDQQIALAANKVEQFKRVSTIGPERIKTAEIELDELRRRKQTLTQRRSVNERLVSPIDGVVIAAKGRIGQVVTPRDILFEIIDINNLMVEAHDYSNLDATLLGSIVVSADATTSIPADLIGRSSALQQQAAVFQFRLKGQTPGMDVGRRVTIHAEFGAPMKGIVLSREAVVQSPNGQHVVFKHVEAERFEPKPVRFEELDGARVMITAGLDVGDKIVVESAQLINQVR